MDPKFDPLFKMARSVKQEENRGSYKATKEELREVNMYDSVEEFEEILESAFSEHYAGTTRHGGVEWIYFTDRFTEWYP